MSDNAGAESTAWVDLASFSNATYDPGCGPFGRVCWYYVSLFIFESGWLPAVRIKATLLRLFGAQVGRGLVIKPHVRIKYPWRLKIGDHCWIGQGVWIDNIANVAIGSHVCVSQGSYFCTGSHDYRRPSFDLIYKEISVDDGAWIGANSLLLGGVRVEANGLVAAGSVVTEDIKRATIVGGNPARFIKERPAPS